MSLENCGKSEEIEDHKEKNVNLQIDELLENYKPVVERYFTSMYCLKIDEKPIDHQLILFHSNRICLLTIAATHPILRENKTIYRINCDINNLNRWNNKVSGKGKKGGQKLMPNTILCVIETADGILYNFYSTIKGKLLEMNEKLLENPNLLLLYPKTKAHIAVVLSDLSTVEMNKQNMSDETEYKAIVLESSI